MTDEETVVSSVATPYRPASSSAAVPAARVEADESASGCASLTKAATGAAHARYRNRYPSAASTAPTPSVQTLHGEAVAWASCDRTDKNVTVGRRRSGVTLGNDLPGVRRLPEAPDDL